jgi:5'-methylthioadenosine phosphorylase
MKVRVGIIGGSGVYEFLTDAEEKEVETPFGKPSDKISIGNLSGKKVAFIPRHGRKHTIPPHNINHRANIFSLKSLGVENIIAIASVGIINTKIKIGDFILPHDFLDFTKKPYTFYDKFEEKPVHVDVTHPFSNKLRELLIEICEEKKYPFHKTGVYVNTCGPRLETPAEIRMFKELDADIVGMTVVPEAVLSRELGIEYAAIAVGINYACGIEEGPLKIETQKIMNEKKPQLKELVEEVVKRI